MGVTHGGKPWGITHRDLRCCLLSQSGCVENAAFIYLWRLGRSSEREQLVGISSVLTQHKTEHVRVLLSRSRASRFPADPPPSPEQWDAPGAHKAACLELGGTPWAPALRHQEEMGFKMPPTQGSLWFQADSVVPTLAVCALGALGVLGSLGRRWPRPSRSVLGFVWSTRSPCPAEQGTEVLCVAAAGTGP